MRFILLSDVHASGKTPIGRQDNVMATWIEKMTFIFEQAKKHGAAILQAGDLSNTPRDWEVLQALTLLLRRYRPRVKMYCIPGQHDTYMRSPIDEAPTTMGILIRAGLLHLLSAKATTIGGVKVYGAGWRQSIPPMNNDCKRILVAHASVSDKALFPGHCYIDVYNFIGTAVDKGITLVGDIHRKFQATVGENTILNTGPLIRREANEYNMQHEPAFFLYDSASNQIEHIVVPHQPSEEVFGSRAKDRDFEHDSARLQKTIELIRTFRTNGAINIKNIVARALEGEEVKPLTRKIIQEAMVDED